MKIDFRQVYIDRLIEIENQIRKMRKLNNWTNYGKLKEEKEALRKKLREE
ncbi:hypothetical protein QTI91_13720 [Clostridium perfringens]|nr:hypothetical protein [Clostridium perfringens]